MRYTLVFLLLFFPGLVSASEAEEKRLCEHLLPDKCEGVLARYWWGSKFDEVNSQILQFQESMRYAVLNDDYSRVEKYISFPFEFFVEDGRGVDVSSRRDYKQYIWRADSIKDFRRLFKKFKSGGDYYTQGLEDSPYAVSYSSIGYIELISGYHRVNLNIVCSDFKPTKKKRFYILPHDLRLCQGTKVAMRNISFRIDH